MKTDREKALDKIKKCLRLAKSSNEHEAAAALRQARKLMEAMNISDADVAASEASEARAKSGASTNPVAWESQLAHLVADVLGCSVIFFEQNPIERKWDGARPGEWTFIGCGPSAEIATHAFTVLYRRLKAARADYIATKLKRCGPSSKRRRADLYCLGWVHAVHSKVEKLALSETEVAAITAYRGRYVTENFKPLVRGSGRASENDIRNGVIAGSQVDLHNPISGGRSPEQLAAT